MAPVSVKINVRFLIAKRLVSVYVPDTNVKVNSVMYQKSFLTSLLEGLKNDGESKKILADLNNLRAALLSNSNLAVHVTADLNKQKITKTDFNIDWQRFNFTRGVKKYISKFIENLSLSIIEVHFKF